MTKLNGKKELIQFIQHQTNILLRNDKSDLNKNKNILYTEINRNDKNIVLGILTKYKIKYETHINNNYWIYIK